MNGIPSEGSHINCVKLVIQIISLDNTESQTHPNEGSIDNCPDNQQYLLSEAC